jgi:hypothetical protein
VSVILPDETGKWSDTGASANQNDRCVSRGWPEIWIALNEALNTLAGFQVVKKSRT